MRIDNSNGETVVNNSRSEALQGLNPGSGSNATARWSSRGTDLVNLSSATGLLSIAKRMVPAERQSKLNTLAAQLRSGEYEPDTPEISRAVIQGHLQR